LWVMKVGTHAILLDNQRRLLLGKRKKELAFGYWELPGGHVEEGEKLATCVKRELKEELGIEAEVGEAVSICEHKLYGDHYMVVTLLVKSWKGEVSNCEPDKHFEWKWFDFAELPEELLVTTKMAIEDFLAKRVYTGRTKKEISLE